jgi:hypothetical protein
MKLLKTLLSEAQLLLEYDREKTWKAYGDKALENSDWDESNHPVLHAIKRAEDPEYKKNLLMSHLEDADPTPGKKYTPHIVRLFGNPLRDKEGVKFEDLHSRLKPALKKFHDLSKRKIIPADQRDLGRYDSLEQIEDAVDEHSSKMSATQADAAYHEEMKKQAIIRDRGSFTHIIPTTVASAAHFGQGTRWCTATEDPNNSMFNHYNTDGPLQIFVPKKPTYRGEKYQYHYSSNQLMDPKDQPVNANELRANHPDISNHIDDYEHSLLRAHNDKEEGLAHPEFEVRKRAVAKHWDDLSGHDIMNHILKRGNYNNFDNITYVQDSLTGLDHKVDAISNHPNFDHAHLDWIAKNHSLDDYWTHMELADHPKAHQQSYVDTVLGRYEEDRKNDPNFEYSGKSTGLNSMYARTANPDHIKRMSDSIKSGSKNHIHYKAFFHNKNVDPHTIHDTLVHLKVNRNNNGRFVNSTAAEGRYQMALDTAMYAQYKRGDLLPKTLALGMKDGAAESTKESAKTHLAVYKDSSERKKAKQLRNLVNFNPVGNNG